ncbi:MAG: Dps family protein [Myxococcota bacterium]
MTERRQLAGDLANLFADTYSLYLTTQRFHWNVEGPHFHSLHALFEEQYTELALAVDALAESVRSLGFYAPGTFAALQERSSLTQPEERLDAAGMVGFLADAHSRVAAKARALLPASEAKGFEAINDVLMGRLDVHEKYTWMLRATLGEGSETL